MNIVQCTQIYQIHVVMSYQTRVTDSLQKDIDALYAWSRKNRMSFHPDKCKVVSIYDFRPDFIKILPFPKKPYMIGNFDIDYNTFILVSAVQCMMCIVYVV